MYKADLKISLKYMPILLEFISQIMALEKWFKCEIDWGNELIVLGMCECGQDDCATVYMRRNQNWDENLQGDYIVHVSKGLVILHFKKDGYFALEAIDYQQYPYKNELQRVFHEIYIAPRRSEIEQLNCYFKDLEHCE